MRCLPLGSRPWVLTLEGISCPSRGDTATLHFPRHFNDESPLGLRRILSQSTDSLNMRNRTLSVESLIEEGERAWGRPRREGRVGRDREKGLGPRNENRGLSCFPHSRPGAEVIYNELMSDFEMGEKDFAADSWSLAVDSSFLQQHKKEVMKQQDVIYGEPRRPPLDFSFLTGPVSLRPSSAIPHLSRPFSSH